MRVMWPLTMFKRDIAIRIDNKKTLLSVNNSRAPSSTYKDLSYTMTILVRLRKKVFLVFSLLCPSIFYIKRYSKKFFSYPITNIMI